MLALAGEYKNNNEIMKSRIVDFLRKIWVGVFIGNTLLHYIGGILLSLFFLDGSEKYSNRVAISFAGVGLTFIYPIVILYNLSSLTIFCNISKKIRNNRFYNFLSFYFLPIIFILVGVIYSLKEEPYNFQIYLYLGMVFFICLIVGYIYFLINKKNIFDE